MMWTLASLRPRVGWWFAACLFAAGGTSCEDGAVGGDPIDAASGDAASGDAAASEGGGGPGEEGGGGESLDAHSDEEGGPGDATSLPDGIGPALPPIEVHSDFESGSIGQVTTLSPRDLRLALRDDNDDSSLPKTFRTWWYVRLDNVPVGEPLTVRITNRGWSTHYVPIFSYDNERWHHFDDAEVISNEATVIMTRAFEHSTVWMARTFPYTQTQMTAWLDDLEPSPYVARSQIGETVQGRAIERVVITDPRVPDAGKQRVWLHARTHPAETGGSFLLEGLVRWLLGGDPFGEAALERLVIDIVPMHNVDGVVVGNYRTTPGSINLESSWFMDGADSFELLPSAPQEVRVLRDAFAASAMDPSAPPIRAALNLHSSNSWPDRPVFFFPHFGPAEAGYAPDEVALWDSHVQFIDAVRGHYGAALVEPAPPEGGSGWVFGNYPESWWWKSFGPDVMAITLETVYGRAGFDHWVTDEDIRDLGEAVGRALLDLYAD